MFLAVALLILGIGAAEGHDIITTKITWSKEISRLFYQRCASCHREGGAAFPLTTYEEVRPWATAIKEEVLERRMPPWNAVKGFGQFRNDRGLTQEEIELISNWVEGGAPQGDPKYIPAMPAPGSWQDAAVPAGTSEVAVSAGAKLESAGRVIAVRPKNLKPGASVQVVAVRPDGTVEPLLWIYRYNPQFNRTYYYSAPLKLPAGTRVEMSPPGAATLDLFTKKPAG